MGRTYLLSDTLKTETIQRRVVIPVCSPIRLAAEGISIGNSSNDSILKMSRGFSTTDRNSLALCSLPIATTYVFAPRPLNEFAAAPRAFWVAVGDVGPAVRRTTI